MLPNLNRGHVTMFTPLQGPIYLSLATTCHGLLMPNFKRLALSVPETGWVPHFKTRGSCDLHKIRRNMNNLATAVQHFVRKVWKLTELLIVKFLVLKITISNVVS